ncbi:MAG: hypothetical protein H6Q13_439 [Bacteroidetes bacterium]|jgi:DNA-directed RNA polymerase subunit RPC12/RpoP|nr:hypothetical protein [Bacteroidota bacterium]
MKTVRLTTCDNAIQAHLLQGALENEGIESILHNENFSTLLPGYANIMGGGVQVLVMECDLEQALKILSRNTPLNKKYCPYCGSEDIYTSLGKRKCSKLFFALFSGLLAATPLGNIRSVYQCSECSGEFDVPAESPHIEKQDEVVDETLNDVVINDSNK